MTTIGLEFVVPALLGYGIDRWLGSSPWLTVGGAVLGMGVGMLRILRLPAELARAEADDQLRSPRSGGDEKRDNR